MIKSCERCGRSFSCVPGGCWCSAVPLSEAELTAIGRKFHDCLCPACLANISAELTEAPQWRSVPKIYGY